MVAGRPNFLYIGTKSGIRCWDMNGVTSADVGIGIGGSMGRPYLARSLLLNTKLLVARDLGRSYYGSIHWKSFQDIIP
jgi:hypothetical protein